MSRSGIRLFSLGIVLLALCAAPFGSVGLTYMKRGFVVLIILIAIYEIFRDRSKDDALENQYIPELDLSQKALDDSVEDKQAAPKKPPANE